MYLSKQYNFSYIWKFYFMFLFLCIFFQFSFFIRAKSYIWSDVLSLRMSWLTRQYEHSNTYYMDQHCLIYITLSKVIFPLYSFKHTLFHRTIQYIYVANACLHLQLLKYLTSSSRFPKINLVKLAINVQCIALVFCLWISSENISVVILDWFLSGQWLGVYDITEVLVSLFW